MKMFITSVTSRVFSLCIVLVSYSFGSMVVAAEGEQEAAAWTSQLMQGRLANGLHYVVYPSTKTDEPFNLRLIVQAGAIDEPEAAGIAHAVEHMVFRETAGHPETIHRYLARLGWKTGLQVNAVTGLAQTQYMIRTRPRDALDLDGAMALISQLAFHAQFNERSWQQERQIIVEEMRQQVGVAARINEQKRAITRHGSRYAGRTTLGDAALLARLEAADLHAFYRRHYRPANMILIASGQVDKVAFERALQRYFSQPDDARPTPRPYVELPLAKQLFVGMIQDDKGTTSRVAIGLRQAQAPRSTLEGKRAALENYFLRKFLREHVRRRSQALPAGITSWSLSLDEPTPARLTLAMAATSADHQAGLDFLLQQHAYLRRHGVDTSLLPALKQQALRQLDAVPEQWAGRNYAQWEDKITEAVLHSGPIEEPEIYQQRTRQWVVALTAERLQQRLNSLLDAEDQFAYFQVPGGKTLVLPSAEAIQLRREQIAAQPLPALPELRPVVQKAATPQVSAPRLPEPKGQGGRIIMKRHDGALPLIEWQLANGDRIVWLRRPTADGKLLVRLQTEGGYLNRRYSSVNSQTAVQIWQQSGFSFWSPEKNAAYRASVSQPHWTWDLQAGRLDLAARVAPAQLGALFGEYVHSLTSGRIARYVLDEVKPSLLDQAARPASREQAAWQQLLYPAKGETRPSVTTDPLVLARIARDHLRAPARVYLLGEYEEAALQSLILRYLAPLSRQPALMTAREPQQPGIRNQHLSVLEPGRAQVRLQGATPMAWTPERAFVVSSLNPLAQSALKEELRLKLSGVYSVSFEMTLDPQLNQVVSELSFSCAPERAEALLEAAQQVLARLGATVATYPVARLQQDVQFAEQLRLQDDNTWLRRLMLSHEAYGDGRYLQSMTTLPEQIVAAPLSRLAQQIFPQPNRVSLILQPETNAVLE
ncbi:insulinase family protein [Pseudaeromonas sharmana]|uniref:Insulinase family protein n=1 Tax=Pseudaeromonas sharmana TaxID=328412 RepID=A0ABV8CP09_9GAMM